MGKKKGGWGDFTSEWVDSKLDKPTVLPALEKAPTKHKYNVSSKVEERTVDGIVFDSKLEANSYRWLLDFFKPEEIELQTPFELQEKFTGPNGKKYRAINFHADFVLRSDSGEDFVIDIKGMALPTFKIKEKLFVKRHSKPLYIIKNKKELLALVAKIKGKQDGIRTDKGNIEKSIGRKRKSPAKA